ncbi:MAG: polysaccharide deacetylase family protein [Lachnospiraceae bacterium]
MEKCRRNFTVTLLVGEILALFAIIASIAGRGTTVVQADAAQEVKKVYLTFDDGPSARTDEVLDILAKYNVKATFFVIADLDASHKQQERYRRIVNEGHTLAIHSYVHDYNKIYKNIDSFSEDVLKMKKYIYNMTGYEAFLYRFPGGSSNYILGKGLTAAQCIQWLESNNLIYYDWNVSSGDALSEPITVQGILDNIFKGRYSVIEQDNPVVLMHDSYGKKTTVEALPIIIEKILELGYEIAPITRESVPVHHNLR